MTQNPLHDVAVLRIRRLISEGSDAAVAVASALVNEFERPSEVASEDQLAAVDEVIRDESGLDRSARALRRASIVTAPFGGNPFLRGKVKQLRDAADKRASDLASFAAPIAALSAKTSREAKEAADEGAPFLSETAESIRAEKHDDPESERIAIAVFRILASGAERLSKSSAIFAQNMRSAESILRIIDEHTKHMASMSQALTALLSLMDSVRAGERAKSAVRGAKVREHLDDILGHLRKDA